MSTPLVSVIIPVHNAQNTLAKTIDSVLTQTVTDLELIVVNDGSTDETASVIQSYYDPRIIYIAQERLERCVARNMGASIARGSYLAFLDADDWWKPEKLEKQIPVLINNPNLGLVYCDVYYAEDPSQKILFRYGSHYKMYRGKVWEPLFFRYNFIQSPTPIIPRHVFQQVGGFDPDLPPLEDWDLWLRIAWYNSIDFIDEPLAYYRWHKNATDLRQPNEILFRCQLKLYDRFVKTVPATTPWLQQRLAWKRAELYYTYGMALLRKQRWPEARAHFLEAQRLSPVYPLTYARLVQLYWRGMNG